MAYEFVRRADGLVMCRLDPQEKAVVAQVAQEVSDLIRADLGIGAQPPRVQQAAASDDPLERLEAEFAASGPRAPSDTAVQRLFPAASEEAELAAEFRRLGQQDLAESKLRALGIVQRSIDGAGPIRAEIVLDPESSAAWLTALNDMRLVLADRLSLRRDDDIETLRMLRQIENDADLSDVPGAPGTSLAEEHEGEDEESTVAGPDLVLAVYDLLTWLQESLVGVQAHDDPER
ncbi:DUF2017 domain-containing protein [Brachybacterium huguangmaarense]|uniref:DUF2017 domain-containing protein n=1 Tax=Brachybacterium huguangmaarense TaxID=1652028 RepID=A0ABY6FZJ4_9MICO|nr:DUF2017 domain-containing protein [Brachybacterium huguangmaarense]UYG15838.1 DUF2017 domain-containing protein [Brachybacterium huguangmaarense]